MEEGTVVQGSQEGAPEKTITTTILRWSAGLYMVFVVAMALTWLGIALDAPGNSEPWVLAAPITTILVAILTGSAALAFADLVDHVCTGTGQPFHR